jgi:exodeoxyribonuclease VII large subunit
MAAHLTLLELNNLIGETIRDKFAQTFWVVAEISEMKVNRTGHCYLELVEKEEKNDNICARSRATIWSYTFRMLRSYFETSTGQPFSDGIKVLLQASVEFHPAYGLSLNIRDIDPAYTLGDMVRRRREIVQRLQEAGVFDMNRELPLPLVPQRIAVISSATAAGYQDFIHQLKNNQHGFHFEHHLFEAFMQGSEAVPSILKALDEIFLREDQFDAVAILRGGGATADLSCFDHFDLAYAVTQFPLPVITGIGHEKDEPILDLVAHTRLKTPTAVAEFFISGLLRFREKLDQLLEQITERIQEILDSEAHELKEKGDKLKLITGTLLESERIRLIKSGKRHKSAVDRLIRDHSGKLERLRIRVSRSPALLVSRNQFRISRNVQDLQLKLKGLLNNRRLYLMRITGAFPGRVKSLISLSGEELKRYEEAMRILDPQNILKRGFSITLQEGRVVKSVSAVRRELPLETRLQDGSFISKIEKK